jgi:hypothetical protein
MAPSAVSWQCTDSTTTSGPGSLANYALFDGEAWTEGAGSPFLIEVEGVPEPGSLILGGIGFSAVFLAARRRRTKPR